MRIAAAAALALLVTTAAHAQTHPMKPGKWDITVSIQMGTMSMPPMANSQCVTEDDLKKANDNGMPAGWSNGPGNQSNCVVSDYKLAGDTVSWKMACTGPRAATGEGKMVFKGDTYTGTMTMATPQGEMTMNTSGQWAGTCTKP